MKTGWEEITIGDLGDVITGNTPPRKHQDFYGDHTLFVKPTDIEIGKKHCYSPAESYSEKASVKYHKSLIPEGATCVVTIGSVGQKMIKAHTDLFINQAMNAVVPNEEYDPDFVFYLLKMNLFQLKIFDSGTASGRENISKSSFSHIKVKVPQSKEVQRKTASILSAYDELIENNQKRIKLLEEKARLTYEEWFVRMRFPGHENTPLNAETGLPEGWEKVRLDEVLKASNGKSFKGEYSKENMLPVYGSNGIIGKTDVFNNEEAIVIGRVGAYCGSINYCKGRFWATDNTIIITSKNDRMPNHLAYYVLINYNLQSMAGGAAQPLLTQRLVNSLEIVVPIEVISELFRKITVDIFDTILSLNNQNTLLKEARDLLLPRLMMGQVDVDELMPPSAS